MKFPVFSLLAGNLAFSETSSQLTLLIRRRRDSWRWRQATARSAISEWISFYNERSVATQRRARSAGLLSSAKAAVVETAHQRGPARPHITEGLGEFGLARELADSGVGPSGHASAIGFDCSWRCCRRRSGGDRLMVHCR